MLINVLNFGSGGLLHLTNLLSIAANRTLRFPCQYVALTVSQNKSA